MSKACCPECAPPADTLLDILTVEEMLLYTAELKRPLTEPLESKKAAVEDLLNVSSRPPSKGPNL
jgi:hypothetical protein